MDSFTSRKFSSSRDHFDSNKEKSHFRNSKCGTWRTTEGAYPAIRRHHGHHGDSSNRWHEEKYYFYAPSDACPSDVSHRQEQNETRNPFDTHHEDADIHSNHQKSVACQSSEEHYGYYERHSYGSAPSETHPSDVSHSQEQKGPRNRFGAHHDDMHIYSIHQKSVAGRLSEEHRYDKRCDTSFSSAHCEYSSNRWYCRSDGMEGHNRHDKRCETQMGTCLSEENVRKYSNHQDSVNCWRSGEQYRGGMQVGTFFPDSIHQKSVARQLSEEHIYNKRRDTYSSSAHDEYSSNRQYCRSDRMMGYNRHDKRCETQMGTYLSEENVWKYSNHQNSVNHWRSDKQYRGGMQGGTSFPDAPNGEFSSDRYNNGQRSVSDRMSERRYRYDKQDETKTDTHLSVAYPKGAGNYNNCQESATHQLPEGKYRSFRLPGKRKEFGHSSGSHAQLASPRFAELNTNVMTGGKYVRPLNGEHYIGTVWAPTHLKDVASVAVSVKSETIENEASLHGLCGKGNASGHCVKDGRSENDIDPRETNSSSPEGIKKNLNISKHVNVENASRQSTEDDKAENDIESRDTNNSSPNGTEKNLNYNVSTHVNVGNNKAAMHGTSALVDAADALIQLGQVEAVAPSKSIFRTSKKLLVLDLNGILVDILRVPNAAQIHADREHINVSKKTAFKRPFCDEFLSFCFNVFDIGVWSSRMRHNVDVVVDYLMGNMKKNLLFCWDNEKCTYTGSNTIENAYKPLVLKELSKLWDKEEPELPWEKGAYSPSNTLLIDDSPYKALCNPPCTGIFPRPYRYQDANDNSLGPEGDLRVFLEGLVKADDVQEYVEKNPFGQSSITDNNKSWNFYLQVIQRVKKSKNMIV